MSDQRPDEFEGKTEVVFTDRDGKEYPAYIQNEEQIQVQAHGAKTIRTIGLLRVYFGEIEGCKDVQAVLQDNLGTFNKRWYKKAATRRSKSS